jgi:hypothetical protein
LVYFSQVRHFVRINGRASIYFAPMQNDIQRQIRGAILLVLRPLTRALLKVGVGYREFSDIAKTAFVETATREYGLRGRPTNISRVAVMTGLTRKEVKRIRDRKEEDDVSVVLKTTPASQVLHRWFTDEEFLDRNGEPKALPFDGADLSFTYLVKKFGGDVPPGAMRTELRRVGGLRDLDNDLMLPTRRIVYNVELHDRLVGGLAGILHPAALNLAHNLEADADTQHWSNLVLSSKFVRDADRGRIMRISFDRINEFVESLDDTYGAYEALNENVRTESEGRAVGVGVFYFEEDKAESDLFT